MSPQRHANPVSPNFFLQTPHLFFFGLLGLSLLVFLELGVDEFEQIESSFLRFELDEVGAAGFIDDDGVAGVIGTGALLAILALVFIELFWGESTGVEDLVEEFIATGGVGVADLAISVGLEFEFWVGFWEFWSFSSRFLSSAL